MILGLNTVLTVISLIISRPANIAVGIRLNTVLTVISLIFYSKVQLRSVSRLNTVLTVISLIISSCLADMVRLKVSIPFSRLSL